MDRLDRGMSVLLWGMFSWMAVIGFFALVMATYENFFGGQAWWTDKQLGIIGIWFSILTTPILAIITKKWVIE